MILINARTMELETYMNEASVPPYAILSHTWTSDEVTLQEFEAQDTATQSKKGYLKIQQTCQLALTKYNLEYVWIDTCCIDKKSSAELSEAINSMFRWYARAQVCIVFLEDLAIDPLTPDDKSSGPSTAFEQCRWFSRGWCLQELIAPQTLQFHDYWWRGIGSRHDWADKIERRTGISKSLLRGEKQLSDFTVAQRMSWAANRETQRAEDRSYSLLGIFDVYMPLLYGEGPRAFLRLQEEIIKGSQDLSIFAWRREPKEGNDEDDNAPTGLFALSPDDFASAGSVFLSTRNLLRKDVTLNNKGLRFQNVTLHRDMWQDAHWGLMLDTYVVDSVGTSYLGIYLEQIAPDVFVRTRPAEWKRFNSTPASGLLSFCHGNKDWLDWFEEREACNYTLYVPKALTSSYDRLFSRLRDESVTVAPRRNSFLRSFRVLDIYPGPLWMSSSRSFVTFGSLDFVGYLELRLDLPVEGREPVILACGVHADRCWCHVSMASDPISSDIKKWTKMFHSNELSSASLMARITPYKMHIIPFTVAGNPSGYLLSASVQNNWHHNQKPGQWNMRFSIDKETHINFSNDLGTLKFLETNDYQYPVYQVSGDESNGLQG